MERELYQTDELLPMVESLAIPGNFLLRAFFPEPIEFETSTVYFDRVIDDRRLAPFVSPLAPGKVQQPKGFQTESLVPAYLKPKNSITGTEVVRRLPGEPIGGRMSNADRRDRVVLDYLFGQREKIERRLEWMASSILRTGSVTIAGDDYPTAIVNFGRTGSLTKTLTSTARWGESGVSPFTDLQGWIDEVASAANAAGNLAIMDAKAWALFEADERTEKALKRDLGQNAAIALGLSANVPGSPSYKGMIGDVEFYVYNDVYEDDAGASQKLLPDYTVIVGSQGGLQGAQLFGAILDPRNDYGAARYFSKNWIQEDPAGEFLMTQSAPILAPRRINASLSATVR